MSDTPQPNPPSEPNPPRLNAKLDYDEAGNVRGILFTSEVDSFVEFVDQAIVNPESMKTRE